MAKKSTPVPGGKLTTRTDDTKMQGPDKGERILYRNDIIEKADQSGKHEHSWYEVRISPGGKVKTEQGSTIRNDKKSDKKNR